MTFPMTNKSATEDQGGDGDRMIFYSEKVVRRDQRNKREQDEWGQRQCDRRQSPLSAQRSYLQAQLRAAAQHSRKPAQDLREIAAGLMLHVYRS